MLWSFQLYSARNFQPWRDVLATLSGLGYGEVEGYDDVYADAAGFRAAIDAAGLAMPSGHFGLARLESDPAAVAATAEALGIRLVVCPWIDEASRPTDAAGWTALGHRLSAVGDRLAGHGLSFAWHNHDFEVRPLADKTLPIDHLLEAAPRIGWEVDVAWIVRGGVDPLALLDRHAARVSAVHVKDIAPAGKATDEDGWADVGCGVMDWPTLLAAFRQRTAARHYVMEHDNPSDLKRFAGRSLASVKAW